MIVIVPVSLDPRHDPSQASSHLALRLGSDKYSTELLCHFFVTYYLAWWYMLHMIRRRWATDRRVVRVGSEAMPRVKPGKRALWISDWRLIENSSAFAQIVVFTLVAVGITGCTACRLSSSATPCQRCIYNRMSVHRSVRRLFSFHPSCSLQIRTRSLPLIPSLWSTFSEVLSKTKANRDYPGPWGQRWIERCTFYSVSALWFYEYLQTLPMEIENIWKRRISTPSILFLINRYMASISVVVSICGEIGGPAAIARYDTMDPRFIHSLANLSFSYNDLLHVQRVCGIITGLSTSCSYYLLSHALPS